VEPDTETTQKQAGSGGKPSVSASKTTKTRMKSTHMTKLALTVAGAALVGSASLYGAAVVHEPFDNGGAGDVAAQGFGPAGTGLAGNWNANFGGTGFIKVQNSTISTGDLPSSGGEYVARNFSGGFEMTNTTAALGGAGLLNDGAELWFSFVYVHQGFSGGGWGGIALGDGVLDTSANGQFMGSGTGAIGVQVRTANAFSAAGWAGATQGATYTSAGNLPSVGAGVPQLIVGKIEWGAAFSNETLTIYQGDLTTGALSGAQSVSIPDVNQAAYNTISIATRDTNNTPGIIVDELRFGATQADVVPIGSIPEPSSLALLGLGGLALLRRRRR
jgi:hypothetical protein